VRFVYKLQITKTKNMYRYNITCLTNSEHFLIVSVFSFQAGDSEEGRDKAMAATQRTRIIQLTKLCKEKV